MLNPYFKINDLFYVCNTDTYIDYDGLTVSLNRDKEVLTFKTTTDAEEKSINVDLNDFLDSFINFLHEENIVNVDIIKLSPASEDNIELGPVESPVNFKLKSFNITRT